MMEDTVILKNKFGDLTKAFINNLEHYINDQMVLNSFIKDLEIVWKDSKKIIIEVGVEESIEIINDQYKSVFSSCILKTFNKNLGFDLVLKGNNFKRRVGLLENINKDLIFENYVVSSFNKYVFEIVKNCIDSPGEINPIFITADPGLGKTHLLHALGNKIKENGKNCIYMSSDFFTNKILNISKKNEDFSVFVDNFNKYDYVLFDDVQLLGDRRGSLKVFLNIINNIIFQKNKQLIFCSDRNPKQLSGFDQRFISRFQEGVTCTIKNLNIEDSTKIFEFYLKKLNLYFKKIEKEIMEFIYLHYASSIRSLKNAINKILIYKKSNKNLKELNKPLLLTIFENDSLNENEVSAKKIIEIVSSEYKISIKDLKSSSRKKEICLARHVAIYLIKKIKSLKLKEIAYLFNRKDHSTTISSMKIIKEKIETNKHFEIYLNKIEEKILRKSKFST